MDLGDVTSNEAIGTGECPHKGVKMAKIGNR